MRKFIAAIVALAIAGCGTFIPPIAPEYDVDTCEMNPTDYRVMAEDTTDIDAVGKIPDDPAAALAYCTKLITSRGWVLVEKPTPKDYVEDEDSTEPNFTTTGPNELPVVMLGVGFKQRKVADQARTMCHEAVHTFQYQRMGTAKMTALYIIPEGRFAIELPAYRVTFRMWLVQNPKATLEQREKKAADIIVNLHTKYGLSPMPQRCAVANGVAILMLEN